MKLDYIRKHLKKHKKRIFYIVFFAVCTSIYTALLPFINRFMIDDGLLKSNIRIVVLCVLGLLALTILGEIIEYNQTRIEKDLSNSLGEDMKCQAINHALKLKPKYYKDNGFYKIVNDAMYDISTVLSITERNFLTFVVVLFKTGGACIALFILDWRLALCLVGLIPIKILINTYMAKRARTMSEKLMEQNKVYNSWFDDIISGITDIKLWNLNTIKEQQYRNLIKQMNQYDKNLELLNTKNTAISIIIEDFIINGLYIIGMFFITQSALTVGGLISFISFSGYMLTPVNIIMNLNIMLKRIAPSLESIEGFYGLEEELYLPPNNNCSIDRIITIEFRNVSLSLKGKQILENLTFKVNTGEKVAIVGDNGSGKTTILNLLLRFIEPTSGTIHVNGIPIEEIDIQQYRSLFSVVTQSIHLFHGSISENIFLDGKKDNLKQKRLEALFCYDFISNLSEAESTNVGAEGTKLSGGEKQKLALLRALNKDAKILILDEATSNYDQKSELEFNALVNTCDSFDICILVSHKNDILHSVNKVIRI